MVFTNKECLKNIVWSNKYKLQQFKIDIVREDFIICERIKNNEYSIDKTIYDNALNTATDLLKSWKIL
jgi:hypothetical protein